MPVSGYHTHPGLCRGPRRGNGAWLTHTAQYHQELLLRKPKGVLRVLQHTQQTPTGAVLHHYHLLPAASLCAGRKEAWGGGYFRLLPVGGVAYLRAHSPPSYCASNPSQTQEPKVTFPETPPLIRHRVPLSFPNDIAVWSHTTGSLPSPPPAPSPQSLDRKGQDQEHPWLTKQRTHRFLHSEELDDVLVIQLPQHLKLSHLHLEGPPVAG